VTVTDQILAVLMVLSLAALSVWLLRRSGRISLPAFAGRSARRLRVIERTVLTPQHALHLVELGGREMLIATHPTGVVIHPQPSPFQEELGRALTQPEVRS